MKHIVCLLHCLLLMIAGFACGSQCWGGESFILHGTVSDAAGRPVAGAEIFLYDSANTRRPADFIAPPTAADGKYSMSLPSRVYWAVARVRKGEKYGPLALDARHSGEPVVIENSAEGSVEQDFTVSSIRDAALQRPQVSEKYARVTGRILNRQGIPVATAYVIANRTATLKELPDFVSAWTDASGTYSLYIPTGSYYMGAADVYPPDPVTKLSTPIVVQNPQTDLIVDLEHSPN